MKYFYQYFLSKPRKKMAIAAPTADDIFHYRYHHGTNLGSIFVLEKWLTGSTYATGCMGDSELDAVKA